MNRGEDSVKFTKVRNGGLHIRYCVIGALKTVSFL